MNVFQFNNSRNACVRRECCRGRRWHRWHSLSLLIVLVIICFHPRLSWAQPQAIHSGNSLENLAQSAQAAKKLATAEEVTAEQNKQGTTLLIMGDSLSAAYGIPIEKGWVALLEKKLQTLPAGEKWQVINASISGETTAGGKNRFPALMAQYKPRWVILELGANDALRGQNLTATKRNLEQMIQLCHQAQPRCEVMLLGIRLPTNYGPAYDQLLQITYQTLATKYQLVFDPFFLEPVALNPDLMQSDGLHPNANAQPILLERLWPNIEKLLSIASLEQGVD